MLTVIIPCFILLVLKQVNIKAFEIILMICMRKYVFQIQRFVKDLNVKVFNLMSRTNETGHIKWHEMCRCICRLDAIVCNNKQ